MFLEDRKFVIVSTDMSGCSRLMLTKTFFETPANGAFTREFKSREVAQATIYVIVHSLLELSFCTQPFPTPNGWLCRCVLTLVMTLWRSINFVLLLLLLIVTLGRYDPWGV